MNTEVRLRRRRKRIDSTPLTKENIEQIKKDYLENYLNTNQCCAKWCIGYRRLVSILNNGGENEIGGGKMGTHYKPPPIKTTPEPESETSTPPKSPIAPEVQCEIDQLMEEIQGGLKQHKFYTLE